MTPITTTAELAAFRSGAGPGVGLHLDLNFNFKTEGYIRLAQALEPFDLVWLEIDSYDPAALATIRRSARTRIASCESLYGRRQFRPYLEQQAVDVAIIDVAWTNTRGTGGPIETMGMERLQPEQRYTADSTLVSRGISSVVNSGLRAIAPRADRPRWRSRGTWPTSPRRRGCARRSRAP